MTLEALRLVTSLLKNWSETTFSASLARLTCFSPLHPLQRAPDSSSPSRASSCFADRPGFFFQASSQRIVYRDRIANARPRSPRRRADRKSHGSSRRRISSANVRFSSCCCRCQRHSGLCRRKEYEKGCRRGDRKWVQCRWAFSNRNLNANFPKWVKDQRNRWPPTGQRVPVRMPRSASELPPQLPEYCFRYGNGLLSSFSVSPPKNKPSGPIPYRLHPPWPRSRSGFRRWFRPRSCCCS